MLAGVESSGGSLITVGDGGDESAITFVFDRADELVALYQHNQSPDVRFFCRAAAAPALTLPNVEDCVGALVSSIPHASTDEAAVIVSASTNNLPVGLGTQVSRPMQRYASTSGAGGSTALNVDGAQWSLFEGKASRLTIKASGRPSAAYLATSDMLLLEAPTGKPAALVCD